MDEPTRDGRNTSSFCSCMWLYGMEVISTLNSRCTQKIRQMDNDMIRIDSMVRTAMGISIDVDRLARADGKKDQRKD